MKKKTKTNTVAAVDIKDIIAEHNEEALTMDGYDAAIIGMCHQFGRPSVVAYDKEKVIKMLMKDMDREDAEEFWSYNQLGSGMGENTPVFIEKI